MFPLVLTGLQKMLGQEGGAPIGMLLQSLMGGGLGGNQQGMQPGMGLFSGLMGGKNNQQGYGMNGRDPRMMPFDPSKYRPEWGEGETKTMEFRRPLSWVPRESERY